MAKLTAARRRSLPTSTFALPGARKYPIPDASHARNALARAANKAPAVKQEVRAAVSRKFPAIHQSVPANSIAALGHPHQNLGAFLHPKKMR